MERYRGGIDSRNTVPEMMREKAILDPCLEYNDFLGMKLSMSLPCSDLVWK